MADEIKTVISNGVISTAKRAAVNTPETPATEKQEEAAEGGLEAMPASPEEPIMQTQEEEKRARREALAAKLARLSALEAEVPTYQTKLKELEEKAKKYETEYSPLKEKTPEAIRERLTKQGIAIEDLVPMVLENEMKPSSEKEVEAIKKELADLKAFRASLEEERVKAQKEREAQTEAQKEQARREAIVSFQDEVASVSAKDPEKYPLSAKAQSLSRSLAIQAYEAWFTEQVRQGKTPSPETIPPPSAWAEGVEQYLRKELGLASTPQSTPQGSSPSAAKVISNGVTLSSRMAAGTPPAKSSATRGMSPEEFRKWMADSLRFED